MDVEIDGEPFGLVEVDERDAVEAIPDGGFEFVKVPSGSLFEEILSKVLFHDGLERGHFHAFLVGLPVVVFFLHFEEGFVRGDVGSHPDFRAGEVSGLVLPIHRLPFLLVPVGGGVGADSMSVNFLREIVSTNPLKEFDECGEICEIFAVRPFHQPDGRHIVQRDGRKSLEQLFNLGVLVFHSILCLSQMKENKKG